MRSAGFVTLACAARIAAADPAPDPDAHPASGDDHRLSKPIAVASVAALYGGYAVWSYFAWYRDAESGSFQRETGTGFQLSSYAGGADKVGHFWATYALARATTGLLSEAGWSRRYSSLVGAGLSQITFVLTEIEDGYTVGFDSEDLLANTLGAGFALLLDNVPELDRLIDFRVAYFPSLQYRRNFRNNGSLDVAQDYTGQSYMLALHLDAVPRITDERWTRWLKYTDVVVGFEAINFSPAPAPDSDPAHQALFFGLSINMQRVLSNLFCNSLGRRIGNGVFEVASTPYTTLSLDIVSRARMSPP